MEKYIEKKRKMMNGVVKRKEVGVDSDDSDIQIINTPPQPAVKTPTSVAKKRKIVVDELLDDQPGPSTSSAEKPANKQKKASNWQEFFDAAKKRSKSSKPADEKEIKSKRKSKGKEPAAELPLKADPGECLNKHLYELSEADISSRRDAMLRDVFSHSGYKSSLQQRAIDFILQRKSDVFVSFPTGAGKSLCYQLPAVVHAGMAIVVSPLLALIKDQVNALRARKVPCETINSSIPEAEKKRIRAELAKDIPNIKFLYITAEGIATDSNQRILNSLSRRNLVSYLVIDEAHCVTQWGHDFRPDYLNLKNLRLYCPGVPMVALTATANTSAQGDILKQLEMDKARIFKASTYRPNLYYDVCMKDLLPCAPENHLVDFIKRCLQMTNPNAEPNGAAIGSAIVYCRARSDCEGMTNVMKLAGLNAAAYHAGLPDKTRNEVQQKWMSGEIPVVVATIAFGMGIDKANVRVVIHWAPSNSLAAYYQEAGRAGRDNHRSYCRIYYSNAERQFMEHCFRGDSNRIKAKKGLSDDAKDIQIKALQTGFEKMLEYCEKAECRHKMMASFFNESDLKKCLKNCDFCRIPEKVSQQANALKTQRQESLYSRSQRQNGEAHEPFGYEPRQKKEEEEYSGFENGLERMEKEEAIRLKTAVQDEFERRRKARELANGGAARKVRPRGDVTVLDKDSKRVESLTIVRREAIVRTVIQALDDNSSQADNQQKAADIEYNSCYLQSKTLSSYNHKAAQVLSAIKSATKHGTEYDSSSASVPSSSSSAGKPPPPNSSAPFPPASFNFITARDLI